MVRQTFDQFMSQLKAEILILGSMVEQSTLGAVNALVHNDLDTARAIYHNDHSINDRRYAIENAVLGQIATQQPVAHDLRLLAAMLYVVDELERMGDYAKGIAKVTLKIADADIYVPGNEFQEMASQGIDMIHSSLTAFFDENLQLARQIPYEDGQVDDLYNRIYQKVVK